MLDFQNVRLSSSELAALRRLDASFQVYLSDLGESNATRLISLEFASLMQQDIPGGDGSYFLELRDLGRDYLRYWDGIEEQRNLETHRYRVATGISILALLIALASLLADIGLFRMMQASDPIPAATAIPAECTSTPPDTCPTPTTAPKGTSLPSASPAGSVSPSPAPSLQPEANLP